MISVHPSPTAGDGRTIDQSRSIRRDEKLEKFIQCAQCGFPVDMATRAVGPSLGAIPEGSAAAASATFTPPLGTSETDQYADPVDTNAGCPFCNTMNPRAIGRGKTGFERPHRSIENL